MRTVRALAPLRVLLLPASGSAGPVLDRELGPFDRLRDERGVAAWRELFRDSFGIPTRIGIFRPAACSVADASAGRCTPPERDDRGSRGGHDVQGQGSQGPDRP